MQAKTIAFLGLVTLTTLSLAARPAAAQVTLNFDNFTASADSGGGYVAVSSPYSTQGFTLTSLNLSAFNGSDIFGDGETSLASASNDPTTLTQDHGFGFDFNAIDLGPPDGNLSSTTFDGPVLFTGTRTDGTTVSETVNTTTGQFQAFAFTGFTDLQSLTFVGSGTSTTPTLFDNIKLTSDAAPVPEASTTVSFGLLLALGGLAFGGLILRARKHTASA
ncbi:MAG: hypothetical protein ACRYFS_18405 [Janthinobacterium lividum]